MSKIWIELELEVGDENNHEVAKLASNMIRKLCPQAREWKHDTFWFYPEKQKFCVVIDYAGGFQIMNDNGHWFELDYLGKAED